MSSDEKAKTREKETIARMRLRVKMRTPEKLIESKERAKLQKMTSRLGISPDEKTKIREKAKKHYKKIHG